MTAMRLIAAVVSPLRLLQQWQIRCPCHLLLSLAIGAPWKVLLMNLTPSYPQQSTLLLLSLLKSELQKRPMPWFNGDTMETLGHPQTKLQKTKVWLNLIKSLRPKQTLENGCIESDQRYPVYAETLIHAFRLSTLDYCGTPNSVKTLQLM